jgi:hypothetical protein
MNPDLYKPPNAALTETGSETGALYSPLQVAGASLLGGPIAACWLLAENYAELGNPDARRKALIWGVAGTIAILASAFALPQGFPSSILPTAYSFGLYQVAKTFQGPEIDARLAAGQRKQSVWRVIGIGLVSLVLIFAALIAILLVLPREMLPE